MFEQIWNFLKDPANRTVLEWIGGGIVVCAGGMWGVIKFFLSKPDNTPSAPTVSATGGSMAAGGNIENSKIENRR